MRAPDVVHLDDIDTEAVDGLAGLDDAPELDAARLAIAHPAGGDGRLAGFEDALKRCAIGRKLGIQADPELTIEGLTGDAPGDPGDEGREVFDRDIPHFR
ncbi:MAG: hypothetical protein HKUEN07_04980 [Rhodocyclaceae bacterium]|nr:MAG: hypothetical protein HKUEN07_04980 [Rhodocyclaceae bacterium]